MIDHRVAVCRDHAKNACKRQQCKYYHIPIAVPPANVMKFMTDNNNQSDGIHDAISS